MKRDPETSAADLILSEADDLLAAAELAEILARTPPDQLDRSPKAQLVRERREVRQAKREEGRGQCQGTVVMLNPRRHTRPAQ